MQELRKMSETEKQIMELIWQSEELPVTASEVQQLAGAMKEWKHTTVATFLQKLCQKGVLRVVKKGNTICIFRRSLKRNLLLLLRQGLKRQISAT